MFLSVLLGKGLGGGNTSRLETIPYIDGVWEFLSSQECVDICSQFQQHQAQACAETLAKESWDRWNTHMLGQVVDDITAIVVYL